MQESSRTLSTESESELDSRINLVSQTSPSSMMEVQQPGVPRTCTRQSTFPNAAPQAQVLAYPPRQMSLPACPDQESALISHKPLTTSQVYIIEISKFATCHQHLLQC